MPSLEYGSLGASRSHICFLRAWISARHSLEALSQHWWTAASPADIGLRAGPLRSHSEEALGRDGQGPRGRLPPWAFSCNRAVSGESKMLPGFSCTAGRGAGEGRY